ncbi:MAG: hypothetical protein ABIN99_13355, partial [Nitrosospira sp.]
MFLVDARHAGKLIRVIQQIADQHAPADHLGRHEVAIGDIVGFHDADQQPRSGKVIRLNDKTVKYHRQSRWLEMVSASKAPIN